MKKSEHASGRLDAGNSAGGLRRQYRYAELGRRQDNTDAAATRFLIGGTAPPTGGAAIPRQRGQKRRRACGGGDQRGRRGYPDQGHFRG